MNARTSIAVCVLFLIFAVCVWAAEDANMFAALDARIASDPSNAYLRVERAQWRLAHNRMFGGTSEVRSQVTRELRLCLDDLDLALCVEPSAERYQLRGEVLTAMLGNLPELGERSSEGSNLAHRAVIDCTKALELACDCAFNRAWSHRYLSNWTAASNDYALYATLAPDNQDFAAEMICATEVERQIASLRCQIVATPSNAAVYAQLAILYLAKSNAQNFEHAQEMARHAAAIEPTYQTLFTLARVSNATHEHGSSLAAAQAARSLATNASQSNKCARLIDLANDEIREDALRRARDAAQDHLESQLENQIAANPSNAALRAQLAMLCLTNDVFVDAKRALEHAQQAVALERTCTHLLALALAHAHDGKPEAALATAKVALALAVNDVQSNECMRMIEIYE